MDPARGLGKGRCEPGSVAGGPISFSFFPLRPGSRSVALQAKSVFRQRNKEKGHWPEELWESSLYFSLLFLSTEL